MREKKLSKPFITLAFAASLLWTQNANALQYENCISAEDSAACLIAFEKLQTLVNPVTKKRYFHDERHIIDGKLFLYPFFHIATADLDGDNSPEIIVSVPEYEDEQKGWYCLGKNQCPHYIIQDRTLPDQERTVNTFKAIGPIYSSGVSLSTDERIDNFLSLRAYNDPEWKSFDVYQYDKEADNYFNMTVGP